MKAFAKLRILGFVAIVGAIFSACVDINLKSELPKVDYYTLDNIALEAKNCGAHDIVGLESIEIPQSLAGRNLTYKDGNRVHKIKRINLNDSLKANIETMLIKNLANHCIRVITPPFSGIKIERYLRVKMLDFGAEKGVESVESSGDSTRNLAESAQNLGRDSAKKHNSTHDTQNLAQNMARVSFAFVLHQNGVILQSGIITKTSSIEKFNDEGIFNALQNATNKAIKTLTNKMIPK